MFKKNTRNEIFPTPMNDWSALHVYYLLYDVPYKHYKKNILAVFFNVF